MNDTYAAPGRLKGYAYENHSDIEFKGRDGKDRHRRYYGPVPFGGAWQAKERVTLKNGTMEESRPVNGAAVQS